MTPAEPAHTGPYGRLARYNTVAAVQLHRTQNSRVSATAEDAAIFRRLVNGFFIPAYSKAQGERKEQLIRAGVDYLENLNA